VTAASLASLGSDLSPLLPGLATSLKLTGAALVIGLPLGLVLAILVSSRRMVVRAPALAFVELGRGAPVLIVLQLFYFGLPQVNVTLSSFVAGSFGLGLTTAAYTSEIIRAGLQAVPAGQREASRALGMSHRDELRFIVIPQGMRIATPALLGFAILVFQGTSLCFTIAVPELMSKAYGEGSESFEYLQAIGLAAALYAVVALSAGLVVRRLEARMGRHV
jgi:polar amino acid transport system permease protein